MTNGDERGSKRNAASDHKDGSHIYQSVTATQVIRMATQPPSLALILMLKPVVAIAFAAILPIIVDAIVTPVANLSVQTNWPCLLVPILPDIGTFQPHFVATRGLPDGHA